MQYGETMMHKTNNNASAGAIHALSINAIVNQHDHPDHDLLAASKSCQICWFAGTSSVLVPGRIANITKLQIASLLVSYIS